MSEIVIEIKNCNCIKEANIKIEEGTLNIKYGSNGTGKSTISKAIFQQNEAIQNIRAFLPKYAEIVKYSDGEISKKGGVGEFLKGNGAGFDKYDELKGYKSFYDRDMVSVTKWAKWRNDGIKQMHGENCPFCADKLKKEIDKENEVISKVFKNSALSTANAVLEYLHESVAKNYINEDAISVLQEYISSTGKEDSLVSELKSLGTETEYLYKKIEKICLFRPMNVTHEQLENIDNNLNEMYIDKRQINKFYSTELIYEMVDEVENKINNLKVNTGKLRGLFVQHEKKLEALISKRKDDINQFFLLAGFPYKFEIIPDGENKAISYLSPINTEDIKVSDPDTHLSWGEKMRFLLLCLCLKQ